MTVHQIPPEAEEGDDEFEEPENAVLRREAHASGRPATSDHRGAPPDQRPCPVVVLDRSERGARRTRWTARHPLDA